MATGSKNARPRALAPAYSLPAIVALIEEGGNITVGELYGIPCAATAADEDRCLAMLVQRDNESLVQLLLRLDAAIAAFPNTGLIDEINPPPRITKPKRTHPSRR
jgi:hypothetical protein